jgi:hypothetical protein
MSGLPTTRPLAPQLLKSEAVRHILGANPGVLAKHSLAPTAIQMRAATAAASSFACFSVPPSVLMLK